MYMHVPWYCEQVPYACHRHDYTTCGVFTLLGVYIQLAAGFALSL